MGDVIVNEIFEEDDFSLFDERVDFSQGDFFEFKKEIVRKNDNKNIDRLLSYEYIKKNLEYDLPYQREGALKLMKEMNSTALLTDEVGLGKTITTSFVIKEGIVRGFIKKCLILTPPSLVNQWVEELRDKFELEFHIIEDSGDWGKYNFCIASIDRVKIYDRKNSEFRHKKAHLVDWDLVIVDEAHKLKERNTVRWKFVDRLQKKRFLLLTATPFQNDLLELYNLLHLLKRGHLGTIKEFRNKFLYKGNKRHPLNYGELKRRLDEVMIRRRREETGIVYKKRIPKIISVELSNEEKIIYDNIVSLLKDNYFTVDGNEINGHLVIYSLLPKITSSSRSAIESLQGVVSNEKYSKRTKEMAIEILEDYKKIKKDSKIEKLLEIIEEIKERSDDEKILIYTRHPTTLRYIVEKLQPYNFKIIEFMGGLSREEKSSRIDEFKKGRADILISTDTGAEGLNFQFCRNLINYDLPWNPMSVEQRIGRLDRIGQSRDMYIYSLATKNTMEENVVDLIINKMCCVGLVIGELPIILFNLGLDLESQGGRNKIEEKLMNAFIDSKGNLNIFSKEVKEIEKIISEGMKNYEDSKIATSDFLDEYVS